MYLSKRVVGHTALGAGGPHSIPPWRALSKSLTFPSKSMINANIRPSELQKVTFLTTDENLPRAVAQGLLFGVHRKSPGRPGCRAGVAQWLGTRLVGGRWEGPGSIPASCGGWLLPQKTGKSEVRGVGLGMFLRGFGVGGDGFGTVF